MNYYIDVLKKYAVFTGRARRKEYWLFVLFSIIISIIISFVATLLGDDRGIVHILYSLAVLVPSIAVTARRLHDVGKSGWWQLIALIPVFGIYLWILVCRDSDVGENIYGPNPKVQ